MKPAAAKFLGSFLVTLALVAAAIGSAQILQVQMSHRATATVRVLPGIESGMSVGTEVESVLQTEAGMILSEFILKPVVEKLDLNTAWGKCYNDGQKFKTVESWAILKACLKAAPVPGSVLIQIDVTRDNADETVKIANAVAQAYCDYRVDRRRRIAENTASNLVEISRIPLGKLTAARKKLEAAQGALAPDLRAQPPQRRSGDGAALENARSRYNQATVQIMSRSNQIESAMKSAPPNTNLIARVTVELTRLQADLLAAENDVASESRRLEALREYWAARENFERAEEMFAPFKKAADDAQAARSLSNKPPAVIEDRAERAATIKSHDVSRGALLFGIAGVLLVAGAGVLLSNQTRAGAKNQKVA